MLSSLDRICKPYFSVPLQAIFVLFRYRGLVLKIRLAVAGRSSDAYYGRGSQLASKTETKWTPRRSLRGCVLLGAPRPYLLPYCLNFGRLASDDLMLTARHANA